MLKKIILITLIAAATGKSYAQETPNQILQKSEAALGIVQTAKPVFHYYYSDATLGREQSDRTYAPFFTTAINAEAWYYTKINASRNIFLSTIRVGGGPDGPMELYLGNRKSYLVRDTNCIAAPYSYDQQNAWAVIQDWAADTTVKQVKNETYRDYDRIVFERSTASNTERLLIDLKTFFPVKLDYQVLSSLWGQQHIEIVYSNWTLTDGAFYPASSFRIEDGETMSYRTLGRSSFMDTTKIFDKYIKLPSTGKPAVNREWYNSPQPVLVKVSDQTYLSKNNYYTETFTQINGTVYLLDATLSEERARQDEQLIKSVFPNSSKMVVIVTDLAWPHIGGVRYWVSKGATIISHRASRLFLEKVVNRKWTLKPDELQKHPRKMNFVAIDKMILLADGAVQLFPIDGIGSEGALAGYLSNDKFLWASDYIQSATEPAAYTKEVINAVQREKLLPVRMAAEHVGLTDWQQILKINK
ncbi:MAG: hypothetical protein JWM28_2331 [Chitinophagaceae bacterium]|nr:hypothetical protein [Chitinophagaceae bacterium]